ncbi:MAG: hypothetical protein JWN24_46 [Phycisphaerales bacterium]|nr:hypothetical protein [Phycisphaerales bacterium]
MTSRTFNPIGEWLTAPGARFRPITFYVSRFTSRVSRFTTLCRGILALFSSHLKHGPGGHLIHNAAGNLIHDCAPAAGGCPCIDSTGCGSCPGDTPTRFHVTFAGITLCPGCVGCPATGLSMKIDAGSAVNGTYLLSRNGACAWTAFADLVPCTATEYASTDCTGASSGFGFAIQQVRINATQFRLQITDSSNTILLFDATITSAACCVSYTVANALTTCACAGVGPTIYALGTGGTATVTPC